MAKRWTLRQIRDAVDPEKEVVIVEKHSVVIVEDDKPHKLKMLFLKAGHKYIRVDLVGTVQQIVEKLAPHVDIKEFLKELILLHSSAEEILELATRLEKGSVTVKGAPRCYSLMIGGKRGAPYEFNLVS